MLLQQKRTTIYHCTNAIPQTPKKLFIGIYYLFILLITSLIIITITTTTSIKAQQQEPNNCSDKRDCHSCISTPSNDCFWCSSSKKCVTYNNDKNENICPDAEEEIAIFREMCEDPILLRCVNFALPANLFENQTTPYDDGDNDDKNQCLNHKECISDPNCVYISKGFFTVSSDDNPDYARVLTLNSNGTCWRGFVVVGTPLSEYVHRGDGLVYKIETEETFYSTCQIREVFYWVILGSGILLAIICCCTACVCCMCCFCFQCRNREKYESIN